MYTETFSAINGDMKRTYTMKEEKTSRNRMTMITSALKFFLTILFAFGLNFWFKIADNGDPGKSLHNGFAHFNDDVTMLYEFYLQVWGIDQTEYIPFEFSASNFANKLL